MAHFASLEITGRLAADPELHNAGQDNQRVNFRVLWDQRAGQDARETVGMDVTAWGKAAATIAQNIRQGQTVVCRGELRIRTVDRRDGEGKATFYSLVVDPFHGVTFGLPPRGSNGAANGSGEAREAVAAAAQDASDDVPF